MENNAKKNKLFVCNCMKPIYGEGTSKVSPSNPVSSSVAAVDDNVGQSSALSTTMEVSRSPDDFATPVVLNEDDYSGDRKRRRRKITRIVRTVLLLEFSSARKKRRKRQKYQNSCEEKSTNPSNRSSVDDGLLEEEENSKTSSDLSLLSLGNSTQMISCASDASSASPSSSNSTSKDAEQSKQRSKEKAGQEATNLACAVGLKMLLISLVILVFWGKACAIFCTSVCLIFFVVLRRSKMKRQ